MKADKQTTSTRKYLKVTLSKETRVKDKSPSPEVVPPDGDKSDRYVKDTERRLFLTDA